MALLLRDRAWRPARDVPFLVLSAAVVLSMIRSVDQPSVGVSLGGTRVSLVPGDIVLAALAVLCAARLLGRGSLPRPARAVTYSAAAFASWLLISSAFSGFSALVGAGKLLEYGLLGLGAVLFVQRRAQLWLLVGLLVAVGVAATVWAIFGFFDLPPIGGNAGHRQSSFLGEHDFAALATMSLCLGLAALQSRRHRLGRLPLVAGVSGAVGVALGAPLAGLVGLYLAAGVVVLVSLGRGTLTRRALALTLVICALVTGGVLTLRWGELGSVFRYAGLEKHVNHGGTYAASWSQRIIFVYIGGRMFLDHPVVGTGWYGEIPGRVYARYLPDAHARFPGQPPDYFPKADGEFTPQQAYDQILYELGIVGALLFLTLAALTVRTAVAIGRSWPRDDADEPAAYLFAAWVAALAGGLAGAALFGGIPFAAIFWITLGAAALGPSLVPLQVTARDVAEEGARLTAVAR